MCSATWRRRRLKLWSPRTQHPMLQHQPLSKNPNASTFHRSATWRRKLWRPLNPRTPRTLQHYSPCHPCATLPSPYMFAAQPGGGGAGDRGPLGHHRHAAPGEVCQSSLLDGAPVLRCAAPDTRVVPLAPACRTQWVMIGLRFSSMVNSVVLNSQLLLQAGPGKAKLLRHFALAAFCCQPVFPLSITISVSLPQGDKYLRPHAAPVRPPPLPPGAARLHQLHSG